LKTYGLLQKAMTYYAVSFLIQSPSFYFTSGPACSPPPFRFFFGSLVPFRFFSFSPPFSLRESRWFFSDTDPYRVVPMVV